MRSAHPSELPEGLRGWIDRCLVPILVQKFLDEGRDLKRRVRVRCWVWSPDRSERREVPFELIRRLWSERLSRADHVPEQVLVPCEVVWDLTRDGEPPLGGDCCLHVYSVVPFSDEVLGYPALRCEAIQ